MEYLLSRREKSRLLRALQRELHPDQLLPNLTAGAVLGVLAVIVVLSFAALVFAGDLAPFLNRGIGLALLGTVVLCLLVAFFSSFSFTIAGPQDAPAAILAVITSSISVALPAGVTAETRFVTVAAALGLTALLTGIFLFSLGSLRLGDLVRFVPYPVVGGFLAGTGWLLFSGGIGVMANLSVELAQLGRLFAGSTIVRWLPGVLFALALYLISSRYKHFLVMPALFLGGIGLFYIVAYAAGTSMAGLNQGGWLLGPFSEGRLWQPPAIADLARIQWPTIIAQAGNMVAILVVSLVALLLNATGLELAAAEDGDLNQELRAAGIANSVAGLAGGMVGYHQLSFCVLSRRLGSGSQGPALVVAIICGTVLILGASTLSLVPKIIVGGTLVYLGLTFLVEWLYNAFFRLPPTEYVLMLLIVVVVAILGFLQGVAVGLLLTVVLFVVNYSRVAIIRHEFSGANYRSRVTRLSHHRHLLHQYGEQLYILRLQGFIFFGTANHLLDHVRRRLDAASEATPRFIVIDFRQVTGIDSTALFSFAKMHQWTQQLGVMLVLTELGKMQWQLQNGTFADSARFFPTLDKGVEWCENQVLTAAGIKLDEAPLALKAQLEALVPDPAGIDALLSFFERRQVEPGEYLMRQGDAPDGMFFIETGRVTAQIARATGEPVRLETMGSGHIVGEIGFYLENIRAADVMADEPSTVYFLSKEVLSEMERTHPGAASLLHRIIVHLVAERATQLIETVDALQR